MNESRGIHTQLKEHHCLTCSFVVDRLCMRHSCVFVSPSNYYYHLPEMQRDIERYCHVTVPEWIKRLNFLFYCKQKGRSVQLPYNRVYYRSLKFAAVRCMLLLGIWAFFALCSSLLPAFTSIHDSSYSSTTKTSER